jgi:hypothetical protein
LKSFFNSIKDFQQLLHRVLPSNFSTAEPYSKWPQSHLILTIKRITLHANSDRENQLKSGDLPVNYYFCMKKVLFRRHTISNGAKENFRTSLDCKMNFQPISKKGINLKGP